MIPPDVEQRIAEVLRGHQPTIFAGGCLECKWTISRADGAPNAHRAHVAAEIVKALGIEQVGWGTTYTDDNDEPTSEFSIMGGAEGDRSWRDHDGVRYGSWPVYRFGES